MLRLDSQGNQQWLRQFSIGSGTFLIAAATDKSEDAYVAGAASSNALLAKLDRNGNRVWLREFNLAFGSTILTAVATDPSDNLFIAGTYTLSSGSRTQRSFVMRVDPATGNPIWTSQFGRSGIITSLNALAAASDAVYLAGAGLTASGASQTTLDVERLDPATGAVVWSQNIGSASSPGFVTGITLGQDGNPVIAGSLSSAQSLVVGYGADVSATGFVSRLDRTSGQTSWTVKIASGAGDQVTSISSAGGFFYAAGFTHGALSSSFQPQYDGEFLLKLSPTGQPVWVQQFGTGIILNIETPYGLQAASDGANVYLSAPTQRAFAGFSATGLIQNAVTSWSP